MLTLPAIAVCLWRRPSAKHANDSWRETGNGENEEEVEMMLSAEASLEEIDKRLARSSFVVDKRGLEEGRHRLLSESVREAFLIEGGGRWENLFEMRYI